MDRAGKGNNGMKLGIVGTGMIVQEALPLLPAWGWQASALCATPRSQAKAAELCKQNRIPADFTDYAEMLQKADMDAVYVAVPNFLHFSFVKQALEAGRNVIVEKPMTSHYGEARKLETLAKEKSLFLFEAITTVYLPDYQKTKQWLSRIGDIKIASCNYSQYSRRYDAFRSGEILPAFDPAKSGGALMDLNLYNLHYLLGLFGEPRAVRYAANVERGIDTSGVLTLDYGTFQAVSIAAKDCAAPCRYLIQGTKGYIQMDAPANVCRDVKLHLNDGTEEQFSGNPENRMEAEFRYFADAIQSGDYGGCYERLAHSVTVSKVQTEARLGAGIRFPADDAK